MGVNDVHNYRQTHRVRHTNQLLQLFGRAESTRRSIEIRNVITERAVVGVLGNGHQLHCVVARATNLGQNLARKFAVRSHARPLLRHTHVSLVYQQRAERLGVELIALPIEPLGGCPKLSRVIFRLVILHYTGGVCGNAIVPTVVAVYSHFVGRAVREFVLIHCVGQENAPYTALATM